MRMEFCITSESLEGAHGSSQLSIIYIYIIYQDCAWAAPALREIHFGTCSFFHDGNAESQTWQAKASKDGQES